MFKAARRVLFVSVLMTAACGGTKYMAPPAEPSLLAQPEAPADVRAAIVLALADRKFKTEGEQENRIVAHYSRKDAGIRVVVDYDGSRYTVHLLASHGYKTKTEGGAMVVEKRVAQAIKALNAAIDRELALPAKERAEAEKKQREYDLQMQTLQTSQAQAEAQAANAQQQAPPDQQGGDDNGAEPTGGPVWDATFQVSVPVPQIQVRASAYSGSCCINGTKYSCPNQAAFQACSQMNPSGCAPAGSCR